MYAAVRFQVLLDMWLLVKRQIEYLTISITIFILLANAKVLAYVQ